MLREYHQFMGIASLLNANEICAKFDPPRKARALLRPASRRWILAERTGRPRRICSGIDFLVTRAAGARGWSGGAACTARPGEYQLVDKAAANAAVRWVDQPTEEICDGSDTGQTRQVRASPAGTAWQEPPASCGRGHPRSSIANAVHLASSVKGGGAAMIGRQRSYRDGNRHREREAGDSKEALMSLTCTIYCTLAPHASAWGLCWCGSMHGLHPADELAWDSLPQE